jgi:hypothetical protein
MSVSVARRRRTLLEVTAVIGCLMLGPPLLCACGGAASKPPPTHHDVARIVAAMSDIVYQCQSVAAGFVAAADQPALRQDVDALLSAFRRVRGDAPFAIGATSGQGQRTTLRKQLTLAEGNLTDGGCSPGQARRIASAVGA